MPAPATPKFRAKGGRDGLPQSHQYRRDVVDDFDYWSTLGGINKSNYDSLDATEKKQRVAKSIINASRLCWNLYSILGFSRYQEGDETSVLTNTSNIGFWNGSEVLPATPRERAYGLGLAGGERETSPSGAFASIGVSPIFNVWGIAYFPRMFLDNGEFLGLGFSDVVSNTTLRRGFSAYAQTSRSNAGVTLCSTVIDNISGRFGTVADFAYIKIAGIDFLCVAHAQTSRGVIPSTFVDATFAQARADAISNSVDYQAKATIEGLEFYSSD